MQRLARSAVKLSGMVDVKTLTATTIGIRKTMTRSKKMKKTKDDFDFGPELTEDDVFRLCNSLNAYQHPVRTAGYPLSAEYMLRAQEMIVRLWSENQMLRQMLESKGSHDQ